MPTFHIYYILTGSSRIWGVSFSINSGNTSTVQNISAYYQNMLLPSNPVCMLKKNLYLKLIQCIHTTTDLTKSHTFYKFYNVLQH